jgi:hypothetical protein
MSLRIFIDTEFTDFVDMDLISIALVADDGRQFYGERSDFNFKHCNEFVQTTVLPQLGNIPGCVYSSRELTSALRQWLAQFETLDPVLCFDYSGDWALLYHSLDGDVPAWLRSCNINAQIDPERVKQYLDESGLTSHHALTDALANQFGFRSKYPTE